MDKEVGEKPKKDGEIKNVGEVNVKSREENEERDIEKKEFERVIRKSKREKAARSDGLENKI
ncbi:hypothetical protein PUN28_020911 [Cardiocondyla obscurior]|uniref:Uncharacterized protein n=1 Tax=Cardiocondyla obscurior TaxID=286306 RepID=A0AAW2E9L7_9HYME